MSNFHSPDPNLIVNALRFILEGYKALRSRGASVPKKQEEVLQETVAKAEEMSTKGASPESVASEIETHLEKRLGAAGKDEILQRASAILALAQPFELESFQYYQRLTQVLKRSQEYCVSARIFQLRGGNSGAFSVLPVAGLNAALKDVTENFQLSCDQLESAPDVIKATATSTTYLVTKPEALHINLEFHQTIARMTGGTYPRTIRARLTLSPGNEVNRIGFNVAAAESPFLQSFDVRLNAREFEEVVSGLLTDLDQYTAELSQEQQEFKERIAPQLDAMIRAWRKPSDPGSV